MIAAAGTPGSAGQRETEKKKAKQQKKRQAVNLPLCCALRAPLVVLFVPVPLSEQAFGDYSVAGRIGSEPSAAPVMVLPSVTMVVAFSRPVTLMLRLTFAS